MEALGHAHRPANIVGPHAGGQPVVAVVGPGQCGLLIGHRLHGDDRPEHLLLHDLRRLVHPDHHRGLVEEPGAGARGAPDGDLGTGIDGPIHESRHPGQLAIRHQGTHLGVLVGGIAGDHRARGIGEPGHKIVVHPGAGDHPTRRGAVLAGVVEAVVPQIGHHRFDVGIVEDDHRGLAAQLEVNPLERIRRMLGHRLSGRHRTGEGHHDHVGVLHQRHAGGLAPAAHHVEDARGKHAVEQLGQPQRGIGRELGGLQHHGVARGQRRAELPRRHEQRVVPRSDRAHHPQRVAADHRCVALEILSGRLSLQKAPRRGEEPPIVAQLVHLELDDRHRLAHV